MKKLLLPIALIILSCSAEDSCEPAPKLTTAEADNITDVSATISGTITPPTCDDTVTSQGFVYGEENLPTVDDTKIVKSGSSISASLTNLNQNTTYYIRTFFENPTGVYYGNEIMFSTNVGDASVSTVSVGEITTSSAVFNGSIISNGGGDILKKGFVYSLTENPTINDNKIESDSETLEFSCVVSDLTHSSKYFVKAYVENDSGIFYGDVLEFSTLEDYTENWNYIYEGDELNQEKFVVVDNILFRTLGSVIYVQGFYDDGGWSYVGGSRIGYNVNSNINIDAWCLASGQSEFNAEDECNLELVDDKRITVFAAHRWNMGEYNIGKRNFHNGYCNDNFFGSEITQMSPSFNIQIFGDEFYALVGGQYYAEKVIKIKYGENKSDLIYETTENNYVRDIFKDTINDKLYITVNNLDSNNVRKGQLFLNENNEWTEIYVSNPDNPEYPDSTISNLGSVFVYDNYIYLHEIENHRVIRKLTTESNWTTVIAKEYISDFYINNDRIYTMGEKGFKYKKLSDIN